MQFCTSFSSIAKNYNAFLLDLWGCVHDGSALYPGVLETLESLAAQNKNVVFLSNAPRRAVKAQVVLDALGIDRRLYHGILTSGEAGFLALQEGEISYGERYFFIGPVRDVGVLNGLPYQLTKSIEEANFLLNVGYGSESGEDDDYSSVLLTAAGRKLPMLCLNPDFEVVKISGERFACAGVIARDYENFGGHVDYYGKPYPHVYDRALAMLGAPKEQVLAVGDALHTDIQGARDAGVKSALVTGGILKHTPNLENYLKSQPIQADYVLSGLAG